MPRFERLPSFARDPVPWGVGVIVLLGAYLRLRGWGEYWLSPDEGTYYLIAHTDQAGLLSDRIAGHAHPPLYYLLLWLIARVAEGIDALRLPSLLAGLALVPAVAALGVRVGGRVTGVSAALLVAVSPTAVLLSQVIRPYMLLALLVTLAAWAWLGWERDLEPPEARAARPLGVYAIYAGVALLTHYSALLIVASIGVVSSLRWWRRGQPRAELRPLLLVHGALGLLGSLLLAVHVVPRLMGSRLQHEAVDAWLSPYFVTDLGSAWRAVAGAVAHPVGRVWLALALATLIAGVAVSARQPSRRPFLVFVGCAFLLAEALAFLGLYPLGFTRHATYLLPLVVGVLGLGVEALAGVVQAKRWGHLAAACALLAVLIGFRAELAAQLGLPAFRRPLPEQELRREPVEQLLVPRLEELSQQPGLLVIGLESAYALSPLWVDAWESPLDSESPVRFVWGQRLVVVSPAWRLTVEGTVAKGGVLETLRAIGEDAALAGGVSVLSVSGTLMYRFDDHFDSGPPPLVSRYVVDDYAQLFELERATYEQRAGH